MAKGRPRKLPKIDEIKEPNLIDLSEEEEEIEEEENLDNELDFDHHKFTDEFMNDYEE